MESDSKLTRLTRCGQYLVHAEIFRADINAMITNDLQRFLFERDELYSLKIYSTENGIWNFDINDFFILEQKKLKKGQIELMDYLSSHDLKRTIILVWIGLSYGEDKFYMLRKKDLIQLLRKSFLKWKEKHSKRPIKKEKFYLPIYAKDIESMELSTKTISMINENFK